MKQIFSKITFNEHQIWVAKDADGAVIFVNLHNICKVLLRKDMIENGQAIKICPSSRKLPLYSNGQLFWFINTYDIHILLRKVKKENKAIAKVCDQLAEWVGTLPLGAKVKEEGLINKKKAKPTLEKQEITHNKISSEKFEQEILNGPVTFNFNNHPISFKITDNKIYVNSTQMVRIYGKKPREWLMLSQTVDFRLSLVQKGMYESLESQLLTTRGSNGVTWIEEQLAIEFTRWLSPEIHHWYKDIIKQWGSEGYVTLNQRQPQVENQLIKTEAKQNFPVPKTFSEALMLAGELQKLVELKDKKIEEDKYKVDFYNDFIENREWFRSSIIADELRISTVALNKFLYEKKICRYDVKYKQWVCVGSFTNLQIPVPYLWTNKKGKTYSFGKVMRWTPAGREYILEFYRQHNSQKLLQQ